MKNTETRRIHYKEIVDLILANYKSRSIMIKRRKRRRMRNRRKKCWVVLTLLQKEEEEEEYDDDEDNENDVDGVARTKKRDLVLTL